MNLKMDKCLKYFKGDEFRSSTWKNKYALKDDEGITIEESPLDMFRRLAKEFARIEDKYVWKENDWVGLSDYGYKREDLTEEAIYNLLVDFKYVIVAGSGMATIGSGKPVSASNCFVIGSPKDSITEINKTSTEQQNLMKRRGGVGHDLSNIRPRGTIVNNSANTSSGVAPFMNLYSEATNTIAQEGRRGALMLSISINHPDSPAFIKSKQDLTKVTGANISVKVSDEFMNAVLNNNDYMLRFPVDMQIDDSIIPEDLLYNKLIPHKDGYIKKVKARELWNDLMFCAWNTAEPGILFEDRMFSYSPDGLYDRFKFISTNPCGEIAMGPYDSCRLIHLNLVSFIIDAFTDKAVIDEDLLYRISYEITRLGDDLIELEIEAIDRILKKVTKDNDQNEIELWNKIKSNTEAGRRAGIGFTGLSDAIAMLNMKFDSNESIHTIDYIMKIMMAGQLDAQIDMAITRGAFPDWDKDLELQGNEWFDFIKKTYPLKYEKMMKYGRRNISFSTVAPTGTVSIMAGTSSGIEPVFLPYYQRFRKCMTDEDRVDHIDAVGEKYTAFVILHPMFEQWATSVFKEDTSKWDMTQWEEAYEQSPWYESTAPDIDWKKRIEIQGVVQKYTTHSISSTVNLDANTTLEEVADIYIEAWKKGNKGQTIYRDGCRDGVLNAIGSSNKNETNNVECCEAPKRPQELEADYYQIKIKGELFSIVVGLYEGRPYEIFAFKPKINVKIEPHKGIIEKVEKNHYRFYSDKLEIENLELTAESEIERSTTLSSSMLLRHGVGLKYIIKTISKINPVISSFSSAVCRILSRYQENEISADSCPECGGKLLHENGCVRCLDCDYSKCL